MAVVAHRKAPPLSVKAFRAFLEGRPDEERWELIDGVAVMMTPPTLSHHRIASNLQRLLLDALDRYAPNLTAYQGAGVNVSPSVQNYDPEPDVVVVDGDIGDISERYAGRFYLVAEIVSSSDSAAIEGKRDIYRLHESCRCILVVQQDRREVRVDIRAANGWHERVLTNPGDILDLPEFGLICTLADLYRGTPLQAR